MKARFDTRIDQALQLASWPVRRTALDARSGRRGRRQDRGRVRRRHPRTDPHLDVSDRATPHLAAGYQIDLAWAASSRPRQGRHRHREFVQITDIHGTSRPRRTARARTPAKLEPLRQIQIELLNPVTDSWVTRYRGFVEDYDYTIDPSQKVARLQISCARPVRGVLTAIEMQPVPNPSDSSLAAFGDNVSKQLADGNVWFDIANADDRIIQVLGNAGIPSEPSARIFSLCNVVCSAAPYAPSENVLQVIQDATDAEMPTVGMTMVDRAGRLCARGRMAQLRSARHLGEHQPDRHPGPQRRLAVPGMGVRRRHRGRRTPHPPARRSASSATKPAALSKVPTTRRYSAPTERILPGNVKDQYVQDDTSIGIYGFRSWSAENLFVDSGIRTGNTGPHGMPSAFAQWIVDQFKEPCNRVSFWGSGRSGSPRKAPAPPGIC